MAIKTISSPAKAQALLAKISPGRFKALHSRQRVTPDDNVRWKRRAQILVTGQLLIEEGGSTKRPVDAKNSPSTAGR